MIDAQNTTTTLYSYQKGIGANTEAILNRTLRRILYGDLYDGVGGGSLYSPNKYIATVSDVTTEGSDVATACASMARELQARNGGYVSVQSMDINPDGSGGTCPMYWSMVGYPIWTALVTCKV